MRYTKHFVPGETPQSEAIPGKPMVENSAGGFVFKLGEWDRLDRFLILGSDGGTYYVAERPLTRDNAKAIVELIAKDGPRVVARTVEISVSGRAPKNDPALFVLALCATVGNAATKTAAYAALLHVARIGTHLFHFAQFMKDLGHGWGRGYKRAVQAWYVMKSQEKLAYELVKYRQRDGWSHRDMLRKAHPKSGEDWRKRLFQYATKGEAVGMDLAAFAAEMTAETKVTPELLTRIQEVKAPWEALPTHFLNDQRVWTTLLGAGMPITALVRNLAKMSAVGMFEVMDSRTKLVLDTLGNETKIIHSRIHPLQLLVAIQTYSVGRGIRGKLAWTPNAKIVDALEAAYYVSFKNVEASGKATLLSLDVSGSMSSPLSGIAAVSCAQGTAAMAMVTARTEPEYEIFAFADQFRPVGITATTSLREACRLTANQNFGGTDCSLPMLAALKQKAKVETFVIYTDNETWAGRIHPVEALDKYRQASGIPAKLIVVGMTSTGFTIADPTDAGMLDVVGFDTATPSVIADFARN